MQDWQNQKLKRQDNKMLALVKRAIPGPFRALHEVTHPALDVLEIEMEVISVAPACPGAIGKLWQADTVPVRTVPFNLAFASKGEWVVCHDTTLGESTLSSLWFFCYCDDTSRLMRNLSKQKLKEGTVMIKLHRDGQLIAVDGFTIKELVKNYETQ